MSSLMRCASAGGTLHNSGRHAFCSIETDFLARKLNSTKDNNITPELEQVYHRNMRNDLATISVISEGIIKGTHYTLKFRVCFEVFFSFSIVHLEAYKMYSTPADEHCVV